MKWTVSFYNKFESEFENLDAKVQDELLAHAIFLEKFGPNLGRAYVDTLKGSKFSKIKELRFKAKNGLWRVAFVYDPKLYY